MKIHRWISVPLTFVLLYILQGWLTEREFSLSGLAFYSLVGAGFGFSILLFSDVMARLRSNTKDDEEIYKVRQKRKVTLLLSYDKTFETCEKAVDSLNAASIKTKNRENGIIIFRTGMSWSSFGNRVEVTLKKINETLTEVNVSTRPIFRTTIVDYGVGWKIAEDICKYLKAKDTELNKKVLIESAAILEDVYVKPFQKGRV